MSFVYCRSSWKSLSWFTKGSITGTKQGRVEEAGWRQRSRAVFCTGSQVWRVSSETGHLLCWLNGLQADVRLLVSWVWAG